MFQFDLGRHIPATSNVAPFYTRGAAVASLKPGASAEVTLKMEAVHDGNRRSARLWREEPVLR
jgi:hypothetical protein